MPWRRFWHTGDSRQRSGCRFVGARLRVLLFGVILLALVGCAPTSQEAPLAVSPTPEEATPLAGPTATPLPERLQYEPGQRVEYIAQTGDTLPALAARFNTTVEEILEANPVIPADATTMPPGLPMQIPIYYRPFWGSPFKILPDSLFVNGPAQVDFDTQAFVEQYPGWLRGYSDYVGGARRSGAEIIDYVATNFSISPRVLLALLEYQTGALSQASLPAHIDPRYPLGYEERFHRGVYLQLVWAANKLNNGYYRWRKGELTTLNLLDGTIENPDPWLNAASVALRYYYSQIYSGVEYQRATGPQGFAQTYATLFGDPWAADQPHIPGSLQQPFMRLPFETRKTWAYTGGPHTGWGDGEPRAALDFAPPGVAGGCTPSNEWATAVADGVVTRSETGIIELDLDGDGDSRTGWVVFYLHVASRDRRAPIGLVAQVGQPLAHPSCEGGTSSGTHVHIARKYNGEWILASGPLAFNLDGWTAHEGEMLYEGTLTRYSETVVASPNAREGSFITAPEDQQ